MLDAAPHDCLFPHVRAIVHHGGARITAAGLRAGKPTVICPFFRAQPFWGRRVTDLSGGRPHCFPASDGRRAGGSHMGAVDDDVMRRRATELGARIRAEDGVGAAVAFIMNRLAAHARSAA